MVEMLCSMAYQTFLYITLEEFVDVAQTQECRTKAYLVSMMWLNRRHTGLCKTRASFRRA